MAVDEDLLERVRALIAAEPAISESRMFGGVGMMRGGNLALAVRGKGGLLVRVVEGEVDRALAEPGTEQAVMRGRPMTGWLIVESAAVAKAADLRRWVRRGLTAAAALPAK